jgi:predicted transcriptional regulator
MRRNVLYVGDEMTARLDGLAGDASRVLGREVSRSAVIRAAVTAWLDDADRGRLPGVLQAIRVATQRSAEPLRRYPQRWSEELAARLDRFAREASRTLGCKVSPSMIVRVAVAVWLDAEHASPDVVTQAIGAALVRRGRKAKA